MSFKLYDYECKACGYIFEELSDSHAMVYCKKCRGYTRRLISVPGVNMNLDADWIKSVKEVVDKDGGPHCQEFLSNPTRDNLTKWMKKEGVRHYEQGESVKPPEVDTAAIQRDMLKKARDRDRIEI